jgi:hypothetical protein
MRKGRGRAKRWRGDLFQLPVFSFELIVFIADVSGVFGIL